MSSARATQPLDGSDGGRAGSVWLDGCSAAAISVAGAIRGAYDDDLGVFALATPRAVDRMTVSSGTSSLLLGRERDIAELDEALGLAAQGTPQIALVGGDAGIGKTTLVADLERRAAGLGFTVATGHCLDLEAGMSFAPVVEAVRSLLAGVEDLGSRPSARRMLTLLDPVAPRSREALHVLDDLTAVVLEAAAAGPVLVLLEDMHWADRSTQDFATTLSRTARGRLLLVLTFRSDELHRRHPFRKTLAEISRTPGSRRIDLGGLVRADIAGIAAAHTVGPPDPSMVDAVLARSEGNPLYAEELLTADQDANTEGVPEHLSDLLLARIDALDEGPRALLRLASVNGTRLDTETLADLAGLDQAQMEGYLREALDANVLRQAGGSLEFRHPLLREATYDDLMPDERTRIHARLAEILQARVDAEPDPGVAALSRLAFHWNAAHDLPRTLAASVRAGLAAKRLGAAEADHPARTRTVAVGPGPRRPGRGAASRGPSSSSSWASRQASRATSSGGTPWSAPRSRCSDPIPTGCWPVASTPRWPAAASHRGHDRRGRGDPACRRVRRRLPDRGAGACPERPVAVPEPAGPLRRQCRSRTTSHRRRQERGLRRSRSGCPPPGIHLPLLPRPHRRRTRGAGAGRGPGPDSGHGRALARRIPSPALHGGRAGRSWPVRRERGLRGGAGPGPSGPSDPVRGRGAEALLWRGRLDEAEQRLEELRELGLPASAGTGAPARGAVAGTR